ncbi:MAG: hypothetical protein ABIR57_04420 [Aeromicrobium sp.]
MRSRLALLAALVCLVAGYLFVNLAGDDEQLSRNSLNNNFLPLLAMPRDKAAKVDFTHAIFTTSKLEEIEPKLDACKGPVAAHLESTPTVLVAEHDYCGGLAWMPHIRAGDTVELTGPGVIDGVYQAVVITHVARYVSKVRDLPSTDVVLQTCISKTRMLLVGLKFVPGAVAA